MKRFNLIIFFAFIATPAAYSQVAVEVAKITCEQYLAFSVADPRDINIWLSGYYHGKSGSTVFEPQRLKDYAEKVKSECFLKANSNLPVMQVIENVFGRSK